MAGGEEGGEGRIGEESPVLLLVIDRGGVLRGGVVRGGGDVGGGGCLAGCAVGCFSSCVTVAMVPACAVGCVTECVVCACVVCGWSGEGEWGSVTMTVWAIMPVVRRERAD